MPPTPRWGAPLPPGGGRRWSGVFWVTTPGPGLRSSLSPVSAAYFFLLPQHLLKGWIKRNRGGKRVSGMSLLKRQCLKPPLKKGKKPSPVAPQPPFGDAGVPPQFECLSVGVPLGPKCGWWPLLPIKKRGAPAPGYPDPPRETGGGGPPPGAPPRCPPWGVCPPKNPVQTGPIKRFGSNIYFLNYFLI